MSGGLKLAKGRGSWLFGGGTIGRARAMLTLGDLVLGDEVPRVAVPFMCGEPVARAKAAGVDIAEARVDLFESLAVDSVVAEMALFKGMPTIGTIRLREEGGAWDGTEGARQELFEAILPYVDAVDVELRAVETLAKVRAWTKTTGKVLIVSHHDFGATPEFSVLENIVRDALAAGADIVKIAARVLRREDLHSLARLLLANASKNLIVIGMERDGAVSRVLFPALGSLVTFASWGEKATAPGQMPFEVMAGVLKKVYSARDESL